MHHCSSPVHGIKRVCGRVEVAIWTTHDMVAKSDFGSVQKAAAEVAVEALSNFQIVALQHSGPAAGRTTTLLPVDMLHCPRWLMRPNWALT